MGAILAVPVLASLVTVGIFGSYLRHSQNDAHFVNVAGRQRLLAAELYSWAHMVAIGQEEDRAGLRMRAQWFDEALVALENGGALLDRQLDPAPPALAVNLLALQEVWRRVRSDLELVATAPVSEPRFGDAYGRLEQGAEELKLSADRLVRDFEVHVLDQRYRILAVLIGSALTMLAAFAVGLWVTQRFISAPLGRASRAARSIGAGDFEQRLEIETQDELSDLAHSFNQMAAQVQRLLDAVNLRRQHAETVIESVPVGLLLLRADLTIVRANMSFRETFALDERAVVGARLDEVLPAAGLREATLEVLASGHGKRALHFGVPWHTGGQRSLRITITTAQLGHEDEQAKLICIVEDVTGEQRLTAAVRSAETRFKEVVENTTDAIILANADGQVTYFNRAAERILGYRRGDVEGQELAMLVPADLRARHREAFARYIASGEAKLLTRTRELDALRQDGSTVPVELTISTFQLNGGQVVLGVLRDIAERRQLMVRMMQMDRMIAVGTLAVGVAHEINNPLAYVLANVDFIAECVPELAAELQAREAHAPAPRPTDAVPVHERLTDLRQALVDARDGAVRIRQIVRDLKMFARGAEERREAIHLPYVIEASLKMIWNEIRHCARLIKDYGPIPIVEGNEGRLGQVFINLLSNAAQAIPDGDIERNEIRIVTSTALDGWAVVEVRDTGSGIAPEHMSRIFDPFFTTKPIGEGTGLGLSICRGIVEGFGGRMAVESVLGRGTTFRVSLPPMKEDDRLAAAGPLPAQPAAATRAAPQRRVLVVDDEPLVVASIGRILRADHDVVGTAGGAEALALIEKGERFDLILCDIMMPKMSGMELYEEILRAAPDLAPRFVFMTGGAFTPRARDFLERATHKRLEKPVSAEELRALLLGL